MKDRLGHSGTIYHGVTKGCNSLRRLHCKVISERSDDEIDMIDFDQILIVFICLAEICLVVFDIKLDRATKQPSVAINIVLPQQIARFRCRAIL